MQTVVRTTKDEVIDFTDKRQMVKLHREMWGWLHDNPTWTAYDGTKYFNQKHMWPRWTTNGGDIPYNVVVADCFACSYKHGLHEVSNELLDCEIRENGIGCPLFNWNTPNGCCLADESYYSKWDMANTVRIRRKYAKLIRDLPVQRKKPKTQYQGLI